MQAVLYQSMHFFYAGLTRFTLLILPFYVVVTSVAFLLEVMMGLEQALWMATIWSAVTSILFDAALILMLHRLNKMQPLSMLQLWFDARHYWFSLAILTSLTMLLVLLGLVLLIVPGLIMAVLFTFAGFILVIEKQSVVQALLASRARAKFFFKPLLVVLGLQFFSVMLLYLLFQPGQETEIMSWGMRMLFAVANGYVMVFFKIVIFRYYLLWQERYQKIS